MAIERRTDVQQGQANDEASRSASLLTAVISPSGRFTSLDPAKLRGGYYTPLPVAHWLAQWAVTAPTDRILEPSCGDGNILLAGAQALMRHGMEPANGLQQIKAIELSGAEANMARQRLTDVLGPAACEVVRTEDFFGWFERELGHADDDQLFDAVIGNPPFIRYQAFPEPARSRAMAIMSAEGLKPNRLTNIWVPFVVAAVRSLRQGGRMALVVPAELLQVTYAAQLRKFLTQRFDNVSIVSCNELFFENAEQEVLLLLADGCRARSAPEQRCRVTFAERERVSDILVDLAASVVGTADEKNVCGDSEKWLKYFLTNKEIAFMRELRASGVAANLSHFASVDVGVVTGKNKFFVLRSSDLDALDLPDSAVRLVSRSAHLKSMVLTESDWISLFVDDERVNLLNIRNDIGRKLTHHELAYISQGEDQGFHKGYKCSIRKPWYHTPSLWVPDGFIFRQIYDFPRFIKNDANATSTDTIHRLSVHGCTIDALIPSTYTYLTAASAEIEGRSYGGGVLELEPTEAERLLVPSDLSNALVLEEANIILKESGLSCLLEENSRLVMKGMGLSLTDVSLAQGIWDKMRSRRANRGKSAGRRRS